MNTTKKGDEFELRVFNLIKKLVENEDFYTPGKKSEVFHKKKYYSPKRGSDIIFDITVETRLKPGAPYSTLTIIECKHYSHTLGVEDIEEFDSKIRQVGEHSTKGVVITNTTLKKSALNLARSLGLGLMKLESDDQYEWINYRIDKKHHRLNLENIETYFTQPLPEHAGKFVGLLNRHLYDNLPDMLVAEGVIDFYHVKDKFLRVPFISDERIEKIADRLLSHDISSGLKVDTNKLCDFLCSVYPLKVDLEDKLQPGILGKVSFDPLHISLTEDLRSDKHRQRFTLAHEVGHLVLHEKMLKNVVQERTDNEYSLNMPGDTDLHDGKRLEFQANIFAAMLLLPKPRLLLVVSRFFAANHLFKGYLFVDHQQVNQHLMLSLLSEVSDTFEVSIEMAKIRLIKMGIIRYTVDYSIRGILKRNTNY